MLHHSGCAAGNDLVWLTRSTVEMKDELKGGRESSRPISWHSWTLIPYIEAKAPPAVLTHPFDPTMPIRLPFAIAMDEAQIDEDLAVVFHRQRAEDTLNQGIPIRYSSRGVVPLLSIWWRRKA